MSELQRREFHEALLNADRFENLPGEWQAAILKAEQNRPKLRVGQRRLSFESGFPAPSVYFARVWRLGAARPP